MENKKQTAVEWLIDQLRQLAHNQSTHLGMGDIRVTQGMLDDFEEQAKELDKQQKKNDFEKGYECGVGDYIDCENGFDCKSIGFEEYHIKEYGGEK